MKLLNSPSSLIQDLQNFFKEKYEKNDSVLRNMCFKYFKILEYILFASSSVCA